MKKYFSISTSKKFEINKGKTFSKFETNLNTFIVKLAMEIESGFDNNV